MSQALLTRIAAGDKTAVAECLDLYGGLVWALARRMCDDSAEAEDAVQEVFIDLWSHADRFDPGVAQEKTFVAMVARRRLIDRMRKRQRRPVLEEIESAVPSIEPQVHQQLELEEEARRAQTLLGSLSEDQRRVLRLSIYDGLSHGSIADHLGIPLGTVKTHLRRGLLRIREAMQVEPQTADARIRR